MNERVRTCVQVIGKNVLNLSTSAKQILGKLCFLTPYLRVLSKYKNVSKKNKML